MRLPKRLHSNILRQHTVHRLLTSTQIVPERRVDVKVRHLSSRVHAGVRPPSRAETQFLSTLPRHLHQRPLELALNRRHVLSLILKASVPPTVVRNLHRVRARARLRLRARLQLGVGRGRLERRVLGVVVAERARGDDGAHAQIIVRRALERGTRTRARFFARARTSRRARAVKTNVRDARGVDARGETPRGRRPRRRRREFDASHASTRLMASPRASTCRELKT